MKNKRAVVKRVFLAAVNILNRTQLPQPSISLQQEEIMALRMKVVDTRIDRTELRKLCAIENVSTAALRQCGC